MCIWNRCEVRGRPCYVSSIVVAFDLRFQVNKSFMRVHLQCTAIFLSIKACGLRLEKYRDAGVFAFYDANVKVEIECLGLLE